MYEKNKFNELCNYMEKCGEDNNEKINHKKTQLEEQKTELKELKDNIQKVEKELQELTAKHKQHKEDYSRSVEEVEAEDCRAQQIKCDIV